MPKERGFTLIELAIIIVILGLIIGLGIGVFSSLRQQSTYAVSRERVKACKESLIGFVAASRRIPTAVEFPNECTQVDALGQALNYIPDDTTILGDGVIDRADLTTGSVCCEPIPSDMAVDDLAMGGGDRTDVAFIVLSTGENRAQDGALTPKTIGGTDYRSYNINVYSAAYDDIVEYVTVFELRDTIACEPLQVIPSVLPEGIEDTAYSAQLTAKGGCTPYTGWATAGPLPNNLALNVDGSVTGTVNISGPPDGTFGSGACTPTVFPFTATVTDNNGVTATGDFTINVTPRTLRIDSTDLPSGAVGGNYSATLSGTGGRTAYVWAAGAGLPPGLALNPNTGIIDNGGVPLAPGSEGVYSFSVTLVDNFPNPACSNTTKNFVITITP